MAPRVSLLLFILSSLLLPFLSQATSSSPSRVGPFRHLESFGSFKHLEGSKKGDKTEGIQMVKKYLEHYGYLSSTHYSQMDSDDFNDTLESSLKAFQTFYHLKPTGSLDAPTATLMSKPRCGVPDHPTSSNSINPQYTIDPGSVKWPRDQMHIHYIVFPDSHPEEPITRGFQAWTTVSNFTFERVREESFAKIRVYFQVRDKGTAPPLDGPGGILAYAGPSLTNATIHFDGEENWVEGAVADSFDLQTIATHEVGHLLGLGHSRVVKANMYAYTGTAETKPLIQDDIDGIRAKYSTWWSIGCQLLCMLCIGSCSEFISSINKSYIIFNKRNIILKYKTMTLIINSIRYPVKSFLFHLVFTIPL